MKVRLFLKFKSNFTDEALSKMEYIKSAIQNQCFIDEDINYKED